MGETGPSLNVTAAFHSQLNTLCIREFPCGYGSWVSLKILLGETLFSTSSAWRKEKIADILGCNSIEDMFHDFFPDDSKQNQAYMKF